MIPIPVPYYSAWEATRLSLVLMALWWVALVCFLCGVVIIRARRSTG